jgi:hypothetical protein
MGTGYTRADEQIQGVLWGPEDLKAFDDFPLSSYQVLFPIKKRHLI